MDPSRRLLGPLKNLEMDAKNPFFFLWLRMLPASESLRRLRPAVGLLLDFLSSEKVLLSGCRLVGGL